MKFIIKKAVALLLSATAAFTPYTAVFAADGVTRTVDFHELPEGKVTSFADALGGWDKIRLLNSSTQDVAGTIESGTLGGAAYDKALKMPGESYQLMFYTDGTNWRNYDTFADGQYVHISFDIAFNDVHVSRAVMLKGKTNTLRLFSSSDDGYTVLGTKITANGAAEVNKWHHLEFEIAPTSAGTVANAWYDGTQTASGVTTVNLEQLICYINVINGENMAYKDNTELTYLDNLVYEIKTGNISVPPRTVDFHELPEGEVTSFADALGGWDKIRLLNGSTQDIAGTIESGTLGGAAYDKALKMPGESYQLMFYTDGTNWKNYDTFTDGQYVHISFDIAFNDVHVSRAVMLKGKTNTLRLFSSSDDGYTILGTKITANGAAEVNKWHHLEFEIAPTSAGTVANAWYDGSPAASRVTTADLEQLICYINVINGENTAYKDNTELTYFDNLVYEIKTGDISLICEPESIFSADFSVPPADNEFVSGMNGGIPGSEGAEAESISYVTGIAGRTDADYSMKISSEGTAVNYAPWLNIAGKALEEKSKDREIGFGVSLLIDDPSCAGRFRMHLIDSNGTWYEVFDVKSSGSVCADNAKTEIGQINQGEWIRLDAKYDPSSGTCDMYLNGTLAAENVQTSLTNILRYRMDYYIGAQINPSAFYVDDIELYTLDYKKTAEPSAVNVTSGDTSRVIADAKAKEILLREQVTADELCGSLLQTAEGSTIFVYKDASCTEKVSGSAYASDGNTMVVGCGGLYSYWRLYTKGEGYTFTGFTVKSNNEETADNFAIGSLTAEAEFDTYTADIPAEVFIAQYSSDGRLIKAAAGSAAVTDGAVDEFKGSAAKITAALTVDTDEDTFIKAMVWDADTHKPYAPAKILMPASKTNITSLKRKYPGFTNKASTFSFDDGRSEDTQLIDVFNQYGIAGTFNLVSDQNILAGADDAKKEEIKQIYSGQEIANHVKSHPHMDSTLTVGPESLYVGSADVFISKIEEGRAELEQIFGEGSVKGYAWPYNDPTVYLSASSPDYSEAQKVSEYVAGEADIAYARRTETTGSFDIPSDFRKWRFTTHFGNLQTYGDAFLADTDTDSLKLLSVWGHTYEFANASTPITLITDYLEKAVNSNVWFAANIEFVNYVNAVNSAVINSDNIVNNSDVDLYFVVNYKPITVKAHSTFYLYEEQMSSTPVIFLAGDSTCEDYPENDRPIEGITGWGTKFADKINLTVDNRAKRNESTKTFKEKFSQITEDGRAGDYVFIQFGHNDSMTNRPERYTTLDEYKANLTEYVRAAQDKGMIPVFLTSTRSISGFTDYTLPDDGVDPYRSAMKELGRELGVVTLDTAETHRAFLKTLTLEQAQEYYCGGDTTHFNEKGAELFAQIVADAVRNSNKLCLSYYVK